MTCAPDQQHPPDRTHPAQASADAHADQVPESLKGTFLHVYLRGDLPWPEHVLADLSQDPLAVADEYLSLLSEARVAVAEDDQIRLRRLQGEWEAVQRVLDLMDVYDLADFSIRIRKAYEADGPFVNLSNATSDPDRPGGHAQNVASEAGRFLGPAPFFRRGRAYVDAVKRAAGTHGAGHASEWEADQLLRAVEATDDRESLQDFVAGIAHQVARELAEN